MEDPKPDSSYDPDPVEVTRGRQQGLGMGAEDLAKQGDPAGFAADRSGQTAQEPALTEDNRAPDAMTDQPVEGDVTLDEDKAGVSSEGELDPR